MTPHSTEELAKRLSAYVHGLDGLNPSSIVFPSWVKVAKEVERLIIEARIETLDTLEFKGNWDILIATRINEVIDNRISELEKQLKESGGE